MPRAVERFRPHKRPLIIHGDFRRRTQATAWLLRMVEFMDRDIILSTNHDICSDIETIFTVVTQYVGLTARDSIALYLSDQPFSAIKESFAAHRLLYFNNLPYLYLRNRGDKEDYLQNVANIVEKCLPIVISNNEWMAEEIGVDSQIIDNFDIEKWKKLLNSLD